MPVKHCVIFSLFLFQFAAIAETHIPLQFTYKHLDSALDNIVVLKEGYWEARTVEGAQFYAWKSSMSLNPSVKWMDLKESQFSVKVRNRCDGKPSLHLVQKGFTEGISLRSDYTDMVTFCDGDIEVKNRVERTLLANVGDKMILSPLELFSTINFIARFSVDVTRALPPRVKKIEEYFQIVQFLWTISHKHPTTPPAYCSSITELGECITQ